MRYLQRQNFVTMLTQRTDGVTDADITGLRDCLEDLVLFDPPPLDRKSKPRRFTEFLLDGIPPHVKARYAPAMQAWIDAAIAAGKYDVITCEHSSNESYIRPDWQKRLRTVVNIHSSVAATCRDQLQTGTAEMPWRDRLNLPLLYRYEKRFCQKFSHLVATTSDDRMQLQALAPDKPITIIPNGVDFLCFPKRSQDPGGQHLVLAGAMDYVANIDAALFLGREILPALQQHYPNVKVSIVGARPTPEILSLGNNLAIEVTGSVESMAEYLHRATVNVIPMRTGFGIKNKTLEAMAAGVPVVGSDRGLEGLTVESPLRALRANSVDEYVQAIRRLFDDAALRQQISDNAHSYVTQEFSWEQAGKRYEQVVLGV
jgi:polysaccharide biosynthesis protein PslH